MIGPFAGPQIRLGGAKAMGLDGCWVLDVDVENTGDT